ncbi:hypothetical protein EV426DRAFT_577973 [Tirmania nivea]|nr:hypothetical protein EV426DRAFT_577973 [Tirmania nivea]
MDRKDIGFDTTVRWIPRQVISNSRPVPPSSKKLKLQKSRSIMSPPPSPILEITRRPMFTTQPSVPQSASAPQSTSVPQSGPAPQSASGSQSQVLANEVGSTTP